MDHPRLHQSRSAAPVLVVALLALSSLDVRAQSPQVTFDIGAQVSHVDAELASVFAVGEPMIGSYTFDVVPDEPFGDYSGIVQQVDATVGPQTVENREPGNIFVRVGGGGIHPNDYYAMGVNLDGPTFASSGVTWAPYQINFVLEDFDRTTFSAPDLPLEPPALGTFDRLEFVIRFVDTTNLFNQKTVTGTVLSLTRRPTGPTTVQVDPGAYTGNWSVWGQTGLLSGPEAVVLGAGTHQLVVGGLNPALGGSFEFEVSEFGEVTVPNGVSAAGGIAVLDFLTSPVVVLTHAYAGQWGFARVNFATTGDATVDLVPGVRYLVQIGGIPFVLSGGVLVDLLGNGDVVSLEPAALLGGPGTLDFVTVPVTVDTGLYMGQWGFAGVNFATTGDATVELVPTVPYDVQVGARSVAPSGRFRVDVDAAGQVTSHNPDAAVGGLEALDFLTVSVAVDVGDYSGQWGFGRVNFATSGDAVVDLVPALSYDLVIGGVAAALGGGTVASLDGDGNVSLTSSEVGVGGAASVAFSTFPIEVDPNGFGGGWSIDRVVGTSGLQTVALVPGITYQLEASTDSGTFTVSDPCAVNPTQLVLAGSIFDIRCGSFDLDEDGVPDDTDNCPLDPNPDQVDQDLDGLGNVCDDDLDGDGVQNGGDNCPDLANPDQADLDGDGIGDECDGDVDGDSVADSIDNCPLTPNTDQADNDGDGAGDPCDADDDGDGVLDGDDNCPLVANPDQLDLDWDGFGDACDADVDGDGVGNATDQCPGSPGDRAVDPANGCTGPQRVALECVRSSFSSKGQYVSCVAQSANRAEDDGLLKPKERARLVRDAAHGD